MTDVEWLTVVLVLGFWWIGRKIRNLTGAQIHIPDPSASVVRGIEDLAKEVKALRFAVERTRSLSGPGVSSAGAFLFQDGSHRKAEVNP